MEKKEYIHPAIITRDVHLYTSMMSLSNPEDPDKINPGKNAATTDIFARDPGFGSSLKDIGVENDGSIWNSID